jgi:hypothetical protein
MTFRFKRSGQVNVGKTGVGLHVIFILFLLISISPLACSPQPVSTEPATATVTEVANTATASELPSTALTFEAEADAQVNKANPGENAGSSTFLQVDGENDAEVESFIRFSVTGISGTIQTVRLRLYATTNASDNGPAVYATDPAWMEDQITWNSRPPRAGKELDNKDGISTDSWVEFDVTAAVTGNGMFSFVLAADSADAATFSSRQGTQPPELVIAVEGGLTPTADAATATTLPVTETSTGSTAIPGGPAIFVAEADTRVRQARPDTNYGSEATLHADGAGDSEIESLVRFTVTGITDSIESARLRVYVSDNGTDNGPAVHATDPSWSESEVTWNNRPERTSDALDNKGRLGTNGWVEYDVSSLVTGDGAFSFVLVADSSDGVIFSSREGEQPPQLAISFGGSTAITATPTATVPGLPGEVTLVGAGDISVCDNDNDELTAQLLDGVPGTVFTTGDNAYEEGTIDEFNTCYGPTWGRHKDRTKPSPGNHEYLTSDAAGYFQYFNNIPEYYAYDLGSWRIYSLNSEIDVSETSPQITWLKEDLAANPTQCVLAYWHQPRWSSGTHHGSDNDYQDLWQLLYESGADLVLNGHEHNYERFAEMNANGEAVSPGLREIVVGTGGRDLYDFDSPRPASEVRDDTSFGVLKLTLRPTGYDWQFLPAAGSTFTDSGSTECH